jgi:hypothetical protein
MKMASLHGFSRQESETISFGSNPSQPLPKKLKRRLGHPIPLREEDQKQGMKGLWGDLYCPICGEKFEFILIEYKNPFPHIFSPWEKICMEELEQDITKCPKCGHNELLLNSF